MQRILALGVLRGLGSHTQGGGGGGGGGVFLGF